MLVHSRADRGAAKQVSHLNSSHERKQNSSPARQLSESSRIGWQLVWALTKEEEEEATITTETTENPNHTCPAPRLFPPLSTLHCSTLPFCRPGDLLVAFVLLLNKQRDKQQKCVIDYIQRLTRNLCLFYQTRGVELSSVLIVVYSRMDEKAECFSLSPSFALSLARLFLRPFQPACLLASKQHHLVRRRRRRRRLYLGDILLVPEMMIAAS